MRRFAIVLVLLLLVSHGVARRTMHALHAQDKPPEEARALDRTLPRAIERIAPSLLKVRPAGPAADMARKTRSAVALERDFAVMDAVSIAITGVDDLVLEDPAGKLHKAHVRGRDSRLRVVALEVEDGGLVPAPRAPALPEAGSFLLALGATYGAKPNATFGIVSATGRFEGRALQVDCGIDGANAGGAVVDLEGRLVGVPVLVDRKLGDDSGVGFVVPVARILTVEDRLRAGDDIQPGLMGIGLPQDEPEISPSLDGGVRIEGVVSDGPAQKAGLQANDVIVKMDGHSVKSIKDFLSVLSDHAAGDKITIVYLREGREATTTLTLVAR
ncbi:MAG TPA: S1C family serine protease [Planctomycetota bacterium]|nr:S1C family serine protease [Planctomycetota bacterium]